MTDLQFWLPFHIIENHGRDRLDHCQFLPLCPLISDDFAGQERSHPIALSGSNGIGGV